MLIKAVDDKSKRLRLLEDLQNSPRLDARQKDWLATALRNTRQGIHGERNAAHYVDNYLASSKNHMVLHDLRILVDEEVAQIDHLLIGRLEFILLETKSFGGNVTVNELGEFAVQYPGERIYNIPSPLEQSRRHENVLAKLLDRLEIKPRTGGRHRMQHLVLVDPKCAIQRPDVRKLDTSFLMKADQFPEWHKKSVERNPSIMQTISGLADVRGQQTIRDWSEEIARQHRPSNLLDLPDFMKPREEVIATSPPMVSTARPKSAAPPSSAELAVNSAPPQRKLICGACGGKISFAEGKFCWNQAQRFGGSQYCREHQAAFK